MKVLLLLAAAAMVLGGIYHQEIGEAFSSKGGGSYARSSGGSVTGSVGRMGQAQRRSMDNIGRSLNR